MPLHRMNEALETLQAWQQANPGVLHYPFILRCTGPSEAWLSAAYDKSVCWVGFLVYLAADGTFVNGSMEQMRELQQLLVPLGGIPILASIWRSISTTSGPAAALERLPGPQGRARSPWPLREPLA